MLNPLDQERLHKHERFWDVYKNSLSLIPFPLLSRIDLLDVKLSPSPRPFLLNRLKMPAKLPVSRGP